MRQCEVCQTQWSPLPVCPQCRASAVPEMVLQPGNEAAYAQYIAALRALEASERSKLLTDKQRGQLLAARSNAAFLERRLDTLATAHQGGTLPPGSQAAVQAWETAMNGLMEALLDEGRPGSVFTRDIDQGEMAGQSGSGGTMSATYRIPRGIGRLRNAADFNRGGAAGSYVRFLSCRPRIRTPGSPPESAPLAVGSIGNSGITVIYDALSIVLHNSAPGQFFFNPQDSAGRVFGTAAVDERALRRQGKESERVLGRANPDYWRRDQGTIPDANLDEDYILEQARGGIILLTLQVREGQRDSQEYNEQILFHGAPVTAIKAILIHRPAVTPGRPPEVQEVPADRVARQRQRQEEQRAEQQTALDEMRKEHAGLDRFIAALRATGQWRTSENVQRSLRNAHARITELVAAEARLERALLVDGSVPTERSVPRMEPRTDRIIRGRAAWEDDGLPDALGQFAGKVGCGGVPIRFLFRHVNPQQVRRDQLPALAAEIHAAGVMRWQQTALATP